MCAPVVGSSGLLGVIEMNWQVPRTLDETERNTTAALASYVAQALERSQLIERRVGVAHQLQSAMLTTLPEVPGLRMAACYVPAGAEEWVGGDWYDAIRLPPTGDADVVVAVTVGDVIGHDIPAAAVMGQARAMLRQAAFDRPGGGPADVFTQLRAGLRRPGHRGDRQRRARVPGAVRGTGTWTMTWTSAGPPAPALACPGKEVQRLELDPEKQGMLFGYRDVYDVARVDARIELPSGCTVLFYSDGVIEVPGLHIDEQIDELADVLYENQARGPQRSWTRSACRSASATTTWSRWRCRSRRSRSGGRGRAASSRPSARVAPVTPRKTRTQTSPGTRVSRASRSASELRARPRRRSPLQLEHRPRRREQQEPGAGPGRRATAPARSPTRTPRTRRRRRPATAYSP